MTGDRRWATEMVRVLDQARAVVARGEVAFFDPANPVEFAAARMVVLDLDVAAEKLSPDFKAAHTQIPWRELARTRDKFAHHSEDIDRPVVWNVLAHRLPGIARTLKATLTD